MLIGRALARNGKEYSTARAAWKLPFQATITEPNGPSPGLGGAIMTGRAHSWMAASTGIGARAAQHQQVGAAAHRHQGIQGRGLGCSIGGAFHRGHDLLVGALALL